MMVLFRLNEDILKEVVLGCLKKKGYIINIYLLKDEVFGGYFYFYIIFIVGDYGLK